MNQPLVQESRTERERRRCDLLCRTAAYVCADLSASGNERFTFAPADLAEVARTYFDAVERLRDENGMTTRINHSKIAALTILEILRHKPITADKNARDTVHLAMANSWYAYVVALNLLKIDVASVDEAIGEEIQFLIRMRVEPGECDLRTLILIIDLLKGSTLYLPPSSCWRRLLAWVRK